MFKKIFTICLCFLLVISLCACNKISDIPTTPSEPVKYEATASIIDSWKDTTGDAPVYVTSIVLYSEDFYSCPTDGDVKILIDNNYETLVEAVAGSTIAVYTMNKNLHHGVYTHMKIKSPKLLDVKKIYVALEGPVEYKENVETSEEYQKINGSLDGWASLLVQLSTRNQPSTKNGYAMVDSLNHGIVELASKNRDRFYYSLINKELVLDDDKMLSSFFIDPITNSDSGQIADHIINDGVVANIVDGEIVVSKIDNRLEIYSCVEDGELLVGFKMADGSNFSTYDGEVPDAIVYNKVEGCSYCFVVK